MQDSGDLEAQLACKEREWKELQSLRVQQLESALGDARAQLSTQRDRFLRLRDDFQFNLCVLEERDRELERYDATAARAQTEDSTRREEVSELRIQVSKLQDAAAKGACEREELQMRYQQRGAEYRLQLDRVQSAKDGEIQRLREENEMLKRDLQRRVQEAEGELALQKQEMMADFDNEMRGREHDFNLRMDEMRNVVLSHELKVKLLSKEQEVHGRSHSQATEALQASEQLCHQAHKDIQRREWDIKNITAVKDARIKELEDKLNQMEANHKKEEELNNRKHAELERRAREGEAALGLLKEAHATELREADGRRVELQARLDSLLKRQRRRDQSHTDELQQRDQQLQELRTQLEMTRAGWDTYIKQVSKETVAKDTELLSAGEREAKVRTELQKCKEDVERYKGQLASAVHREQALEQKRVQLELDWQRRCEDVRTQHYLKSEELIEGLNKARDQATAELRERKRELHEATALLHSITLERDQALQETRGGPSKDTQRAGADAGSFPSEEIRRLQQQNGSLRAVVAEMRRDMEALSRQLPAAPPPQTPEPRPADTTEYTQALEEELKEVKARCRRIGDQLEEASKSPAPAPASFPGFPVAPDNAYLQNHVRSLNETIGGLRTEKVASAAALRKQEVRLAHLESTVAQLTQQCHSKQVESEELRLQLANQRRSWAAEEAGLRQRLAAAEMELEEVRREAEEYQKGSLLHSLETVALGNQVSALKLDIASKREPVVFEQGEMVRPLQEENLRLRQQLWLQGPARGGPAGDAAPHLQSKLKQAARWISRLSRDKQQLIEMGNRLRARLAEAGLAEAGLEAPRHSELASDPETCHPSQTETGNPPRNRLSTLEQLQYRLTTQELQYAQRDQSKKMPITVRPHFTESESGDKDPINPWDRPTRGDNLHERSGSKENTPPGSSQSQAPVRLASPTQTLQSSAGTDESLRDVWQMVDRGWSPSVLTPSDSVDGGAGGKMASSRGPEQDTGAPAAGQQVRIQGIKASVQERKKQTRPTSESLKKTRAAGKEVKIRNYNLKDW